MHPSELMVDKEYINAKCSHALYRAEAAPYGGWPLLRIIKSAHWPEKEGNLIKFPSEEETFWDNFQLKQPLITIREGSIDREVEINKDHMKIGCVYIPAAKVNAIIMRWNDR
jgi:hypothetical protein